MPTPRRGRHHSPPPRSAVAIVTFATQPDVVDDARRRPTTPVPLMPSSLSPWHKQIVVIGVGKLERDDNVEIFVRRSRRFHRIVIASSSPEGLIDEGRNGRHDSST